MRGAGPCHSQKGLDRHSNSLCPVVLFFIVLCGSCLWAGVVCCWCGVSCSCVCSCIGVSGWVYRVCCRVRLQRCYLGILLYIACAVLVGSFLFGCHLCVRVFVLAGSRSCTHCVVLPVHRRRRSYPLACWHARVLHSLYSESPVCVVRLLSVLWGVFWYH